MIRKLFNSIFTYYTMDSLEAFVKQTIQKEKDNIEDFEELKRILETIDAKKKPIYLRYDVRSNT